MSRHASVVHVLHPGDVACGERGDRLETLLGSCVAVILTDPRRTIGVMCHIVHSSGSLSEPGNAAHAGPAIDRMYALLTGRGIQPRMCEAYVYGGGNMFPHLFRSGNHVGERNIQAVIDRLADDGVQTLHEDVGGNVYRRLRWTVGPGEPEVAAVAV